jgi:predicted deacylase
MSDEDKEAQAMAGRTTTDSVTVRGDAGSSVTIPFWRVESGRPGPSVLLTAAQHGNEVQGAEVMRRVVRQCADALVAGRIVAFPMANPPAIHDRRPHIRMRPEQPYSAPASKRVNMNLQWPGRARGCLPARLVHAIRGAAGPDITHAFDLHCWAANRAPAVLIREGAGLRDVVSALGPRFADIRPPAGCTLGGYICECGGIGVSVELSGQYVIFEEQVRIGVRWLSSFLRTIGSWSGDPSPEHDVTVYSDASHQVVQPAPATGLFVESPSVHLCGWVDKGATLGHILCESDLGTVPVTASCSGYIRAFGAWRPNCDVALPDRHPYTVAGDEVAIIVVPDEE